MYGTLHKITNFIERAIPRRGSGIFQKMFVFNVIAFVQALDAIQQTNPMIALTVHNNDGIWVSYKGLRIFLIKPGKDGCTLLSGEWSPVASRLARMADSRSKIFSDTTATEDYRTWRVDSQGLRAIIAFLKKLPANSARLKLSDPSHPRNFPSDLRNLALEEFERNGAICPGIPGRPKHKVDLKRDRVEYDHILPFSRGGSNNQRNIQVLCAQCNREKSAKAL
jgi:hypothetical protein